MILANGWVPPTGTYDDPWFCPLGLGAMAVGMLVIILACVAMHYYGESKHHEEEVRTRDEIARAKLEEGDDEPEDDDNGLDPVDAEWEDES